MAGGPLDRWLVRRPAAPLEPVQPHASASTSSGSRDQQTAEPASSAEQQQQAPPGGTLEAYFTKKDAGDSRKASEQMAEPPCKRSRAAARCTFNWQLTGRMSAGTAAHLQHQHAATYRQHAILATHAWQRPLLGGGTLSPEEAGCVQCAYFDSQGELLIAGSEEGVISVHSTAQLLAARPRPGGSGGGGMPPPPAQQQVCTADPLLVLDTHMPKLRAVQWNPADENVVGVASAATRQLHLYDLQHTQGQPKQVLTIPQQSASAALAGSTAVGITDLAFFGGASSGGGGGGGGSGYVVLASGMGGQVFLWDARAKAAPVATLQASQGGAIYAVQLAPDQHAVLAGTQSGEVRVWDLRGGSSSTLRFGGTLHHHPLLTAFNMRQALTGVPGLASQTAIPASAVHSMQLDPCDPRRLAFHLGCGWSGLLHLHTGTVTHVHAPAHAFAEEAPSSASDGGTATLAQMLLWAATAAPRLHRRACWTRDGHRFCVPSRREDSLLLLDFSPSTAAGCYAYGQGEEGASASSEGGGGGGRRQQQAPAVAPAAHLPLSQAAVCAAAHPTMDLLVAGGVGSCLAVAGPV